MSNIILNTLSTIILYFSCVNILYTKLLKKQKMILLLYIGFVSFVLYHYMGQTSTYIALIGVLILIAYFSNHKVLDICCSLFGYLFSVAFNQPSLWILQAITNMDLAEIITHDNIAIIFSLIFCVFCYISTSCLGYLFHKCLHIDKVLENTRLLFLFLYTILFFGFLFVFNISYGDHIGYSYNVIKYNGIMIFGSFILTMTIFYYIYYIVYEDQIRKRKIEAANSLLEYTSIMERQNQSLEKFRHDCNNFLLTMNDYIANKDVDALETYFSKIVTPVRKAIIESNAQLKQMSNIQQIPIKSIVVSKLTDGMELGLKTEVNVYSPINDFCMDIVDLSRVLGIFLDNAIEAAVTSTEKELAFCVLKKKNEICIIVKNSTVPLLYPVSKLYENGISSKGKGRGMGLHNVVEILKDYKNVRYDTIYKAPYFEQHFFIYGR